MELLVSLAILVTVTGAVFEQINSMQKKSASEATNVDLTQQSRDFLNQTVRDLHMAGYPAASMYSESSAHSWWPTGLVRVSPTEILMEGDVNNDGDVESVDITYVANDPNDPTARASAEARRQSTMRTHSIRGPILFIPKRNRYFLPVPEQANPVKTCLRSTIRTETVDPRRQWIFDRSQAIKS